MGKAANVAKKAAWAEEKSLSAESNVREVDVTRGAANGAGESELFEKKLSKEEKKAAAAAAKADRALRKAAAGETVEEDDGEVDDLKKSMSSSSLKSKSSSGSLAKKGKKMTASEKAASDNAELEAELLAARVRAAEERTRLGAYKGALEAASFTLPNPGGGAPLLEDASFTLVRGRRYALIGRNGKGKSTLLRALAARRYGNIPANVSVFYVRQEVHLTEVSKKQTPAQCIVAADIERAVLMKECAIYEADGAELTEAQQKRHCEVLEQLEVIEADSAPRRAEELLIGLGFSEELRNRPLEALSGGWRVRTMLAAAIFARPDLLLLDEPTNHLSIGAVMWLARELATSETWKERTVVIVSHDRFFLDETREIPGETVWAEVHPRFEVCGDCLHISGAARRLTQSHGNYSTWFQRRCDQRALYEKEKLLRENEIDKLKESLPASLKKTDLLQIKSTLGAL